MIEKKLTFFEKLFLSLRDISVLHIFQTLIKV